MSKISSYYPYNSGTASGKRGREDEVKEDKDSSTEYEITLQCWLKYILFISSFKNSMFLRKAAYNLIPAL
jgi:hypothetical protein